MRKQRVLRYTECHGLFSDDDNDEADETEGETLPDYEYYHPDSPAPYGYEEEEGGDYYEPASDEDEREEEDEGEDEGEEEEEEEEEEGDIEEIWLE